MVVAGGAFQTVLGMHALQTGGLAADGGPQLQQVLGMGKVHRAELLAQNLYSHLFGQTVRNRSKLGCF